MNRIDQLKNYDKHYSEGNPLITDTEYDILYNETKQDFPDDPYFNCVGSQPTGKTVKLPFVLGSLDKKKTDTVAKWAKGNIIVSDKLDGVSFMATWVDGKLAFGATRGDGAEGQNILHLLKHILPDINVKDTISLRGELLLTGDDHKKLGYKNRRNGVAGLVNQKNDINIDNIKMLHPIFYEVLECPDLDTMYEDERLTYISKLGLNVVPFSLWEKIDESNVNELVELLFDEKQNLIFDIDGLVLTKNGSKRENVMYPEDKVAFKVNVDAVKTKVIKVEWNNGRTGKITPLVYVEPVDVNGITITKATGFNYTFIKDNGIGEGAIIGLIRANDVIPKITEVFTPAENMNIPDNCPSCGADVEVCGVELYCTNGDDCTNSRVKKIAHFFKTMGSDFITETTIKNLGVSSIEEMYELDEMVIAEMEGFGVKKADQLIYEIQKTLNVTPDKLLAAFGISGISKTLAVPILDKYSFDELFTIDEIEDVEGVGTVLNNNFIKTINKYYDLYMFLKDKGLKFKTTESSTIKGKVFTITGVLPMKRDVVAKMITDKGGVVRGISKSTDYLLTDNPNSGSVKNQKAASFGTAVLGWGEFLILLGLEG